VDVVVDAGVAFELLKVDRRWYQHIVSGDELANSFFLLFLI
jgi:hypothetical protein